MDANTTETIENPVHLIKAATHEGFDTACGERLKRGRGGRAPGNATAWRSDVTCDKCVPRDARMVLAKSA